MILRIDNSSSLSHSVTRRLDDEVIRGLRLANQGANLVVRDLSGGIG
jgi:FMN-dependent NADH-azoreductase